MSVYKKRQDETTYYSTVAPRTAKEDPVAKVEAAKEYFSSEEAYQEALTKAKADKATATQALPEASYLNALTEAGDFVTKWKPLTTATDAARKELAQALLQNGEDATKVQAAAQVSWHTMEIWAHEPATRGKDGKTIPGKPLPRITAATINDIKTKAKGATKTKGKSQGPA